MSVSVVQRRAFRNALEMKLRRCKGNDLQVFFSLMMSKVHDENFESVGTDYSLGDFKCDGHLIEPDTIYACYGPVNAGAHQTEASMRTAVGKIRSDFEGAREKWGRMKEWVFVNNYLDAPAQIVHELNLLRDEYPAYQIRRFGREQFERNLMSLDPDVVEDLIGLDATEADFRNVQPREILEVVEGVMAKVAVAVVADEPPDPVGFEKLDYNRLDGVYRQCLVNGFVGARRVAQLLRDHPVPTLPIDLAATYEAKYSDLECQGLGPGEIMDDLYEFTIAGQRSTMPRQVAVWSVVAYFFERCTIFENVPVDGIHVGDAA